MKLLYTKPDARIELLSCADILTGSEENAREGRQPADYLGAVSMRRTGPMIGMLLLLAVCLFLAGCGRGSGLPNETAVSSEVTEGTGSETASEPETEPPEKGSREGNELPPLWVPTEEA